MAGDHGAGAPEPGIERRPVLRGVVAVSVAGFGCAGLAACGAGGGRGGNGQGLPQSLQGRAIAQTSEIPVGGGTVFKEAKVVVTQPTAGSFQAFSAVCTHRGCTVQTVADNQIKCFCHGSRYGLENAAVQAGPAPRPLPEYPARVENGQIILGSAGSDGSQGGSGSGGGSGGGSPGGGY